MILGLALIVGVIVPGTLLIVIGVQWRTGPRKPLDRVDYARIHALEYELGFRDDPPSGANPFSAAAFLKSVWTDAPGAVVYYDPYDPPPSWPSDR